MTTSSQTGQISVKKRLNRMLLKNPRSLRYWIFPCLPVYTFSSVKTAWRAWTWSLFQFLTIRPFVAVIAGYYEREHSIIQGDIIFLSIQGKWLYVPMLSA